jgi:hypothetical protein
MKEFELKVTINNKCVLHEEARTLSSLCFPFQKFLDDFVFKEVEFKNRKRVFEQLKEEYGWTFDFLKVECFAYVDDATEYDELVKFCKFMYVRLHQEDQIEINLECHDDVYIVSSFEDGMLKKSQWVTRYEYRDLYEEIMRETRSRKLSDKEREILVESEGLSHVFSVVKGSGLRWDDYNICLKDREQHMNLVNRLFEINGINRRCEVKKRPSDTTSSCLIS